MTGNPGSRQGSGQAGPGWVRALAWTAVGLTVALITVGGLVTNTDSGLACPDWPTCFGTPFPRLVGGVLMEHGHRYLATLLGVLSVLLVIGTHLRRRASMLPSLLIAMPLILVGASWAGYAKQHTGDVPLFAGLLVLAGYLVGLAFVLRARGAARHAEAALLLVITQGLLGGLTVMYQLPVTVLVLHLATSMVYLAVLVWLAVRLTPFAISGPAISSSLPSQQSSMSANDLRKSIELKNAWPRQWLGLATLAIYLQIVLGACVRHTGAGLVCTGWLCKGALWPTHVHPAVQLHMAHRAFAIVVAIFVSFVALRFRQRALRAGDARGAALGAALPVLLLVQIALGIATIWSLKEIWAVTAHLFVAALLLSCASYLWARSTRAVIELEMEIAPLPQASA